MSKKLSRETLKECCEQFDTLTYGSTGVKAPCFCGSSEHSSREFSEDLTTTFRNTCKNIMRMVEDSDNVPALEKQIKSLQHAFKAQAARIEILNGLLSLDPKPSVEVEASLKLLERSHLDLINEANHKFPHVVFIFCDDDQRIKDIRWVKQVEGFEISQDLVSSQSDKEADKQ